MASCTSFAADTAITLLKAAIPATTVEFLAFDLTSPSVAKATAEEYLERQERLDILVVNAGGENFLSPSAVLIEGRC
jgi:NAD(P)-dependent dehydrogenase (short-subunit alcohol dehydrogenase family)